MANSRNTVDHAFLLLKLTGQPRLEHCGNSTARIVAIPSAATAPVMIFAGFYLFGVVRHIKLSDPVETMPAFITILLMPVTGSITDGIVFGLFTFIILSFLSRWIIRYKHIR